MIRVGLFLAVMAGAAAALGAEPNYVWWEAEKPVRSTFPAKTWMSGEGLGAKREVLSGGDWLTADGKRGAEETMAAYQIETAAEGTFNLWARKFWQHGPFRWRFDEQAWATCGRDVALADSVEIRTHLCANWVYLGKVPLTKGKHTFEIRLLAKEGENQTAAFDCFVLTTGAFLPNGKLKPGERSGRAEAGWFAWEPELDGFGKEALLDLRGLNEKVAGESGFVGRKGHEFLLGGGTPVRFWAVNVGPGNAGGSHESVDYLAEKLAKLGVNMVRVHGGIYDFAKGPTGIDARKLDDIQYLVAAMKKRGIYSTLSIYFPLWAEGDKDLKLPGYEGMKSKHPFAMLEFDPRMQEIYRTWAKTILTTKNPYTGVPLGKEPAVAMVEIQNEDSFFFWTFSEANVPAAGWEMLEKKFGAFLAGKYGGIDKALVAWGGAKQKNDDAVGGRVTLLGPWNMTGDGASKSPGGSKRVGDQVEFLTKLQREFYGATRDYMKQDLGVGGLVEASNWQTADPRMLDALERYTYTAGDVIDRHGYFGGKHDGPGAGYSVTVGHTYEDKAAVLNPEAMPFCVTAVEGFPHVVSELGFTQPNRFRADGTLLSAAYARLAGTSGLYFFAVGSNYVADAGMTKFQVASPAMAGTFPAAALIYRRGDVAEGSVVVNETLALADLFKMKGSAATAAQALDALRAQDGPAAGKTAFDPLTYFAGRVTRSFGERGSYTQVDLSKLIDREKKMVRSVSGELAWDYGAGVFSIKTPRAQGVAGFLGKAGKAELGDVTVECRNEFASIVAVSLDGLPLKASKKILLQAMTEEKPFGFAASKGKITDMGSGPFNVREVDATVTLPGEFAGRALDENGYGRGAAMAAAKTLTLPRQAMYVVLTR